MYESSAEEETDMHFRARKERMTMGKRKSDLMAVASQHLLFTVDNVVELYNFTGSREKVWHMEAPVNFIRVDGGPEGREGVIFGLETAWWGSCFATTLPSRRTSAQIPSIAPIPI